MDALEFIRERQRMCRFYSHASGCYQCPAKYCECSVLEDMVDDNSIVPIVEKWSAEHPRKTRQYVFIQQYPEVTFDYGIINIKPCQMVQNYTYGNCNTTDCPQCRKEYWMQEVE